MSQNTARWWKSVCEKIVGRNARRARRKVQTGADVADIQLLEPRTMMSAVTGAVFEASPAATAAQHQPIQFATSQHEVMTAAAHAPSALTMTATAASATTAKLTWTASSGATGYAIDMWNGMYWTQLGTVSAASRSVTVTGLGAGTKYYFDVGAYNSVGTTWAAYQSVTTPSGGTTNSNEPTADVAYSPVSGSLFGAHGPKFTDVQQGQVGDCWLESSFAAVAARDPGDITSMFTSAGTTVVNGHTVNLYKVRFYDNNGKAEYVTVDTELPAGGSYYDQATKGVLWVALAEKAYAEANGKGYVTTQYGGQDSYSALNGGMPSWALHAITGLSQNSFNINPSDIAAAWKSGKIICLGSSSSANDNLIVGDSEGTHAYAVVGYNPSSSSPFELYNPWGASSTVNGTISYNGHSVYGGAFYASSSLIAHDFADEFFSGQVMSSNADASDGSVMLVDGRTDILANIANSKKEAHH